MNAARIPRLPRLAKSPQARPCGVESYAGSARYGFGSFGEGQGPETTKARLGGRACLVFRALGEAGSNNPNLPRFPETVNSKTLFLRAGAHGPSTAAARRADPATGTAMEPLIAYAYAEPPREPIRRHSRPRGRCEGMFWRPFNPKDIGRYGSCGGAEQKSVIRSRLARCSDRSSLGGR